MAGEATRGIDGLRSLAPGGAANDIGLNLVVSVRFPLVERRVRCPLLLLLLAPFSDSLALLEVGGGIIGRRVRRLLLVLQQLDRADDNLELLLLSYETGDDIDDADDDDVASDRQVVLPPEPLDDVHDLAELRLLLAPPRSRCF